MNLQHQLHHRRSFPRRRNHLAPRRSPYSGLTCAETLYGIHRGTVLYCRFSENMKGCPTIKCRGVVSLLVVGWGGPIKLNVDKDQNEQIKLSKTE